jgi:hypothetical protein
MAHRIKIKIGQVWQFKSRSDHYFVVTKITEQVIGFHYLNEDKTGWCFERDFHNSYEFVSG